MRVNYILVVPLEKAEPQEEALASVERREYNGRVNPAHFFNGENPEGLPHGVEDKHTIERKVTIKNLAPTQNDLDPEKLKAMIKKPGEGEGRPTIVEWKGNQLIADGHHRLAAMALMGEKTATVNYAKIKDVDRKNWTASFEDPTIRRDI